MEKIIQSKCLKNTTEEEKLEPGEEEIVTYPYEICSIWFHKKDWKNIEMRSFWMTFSSYPDKIVLYL